MPKPSTQLLGWLAAGLLVVIVFLTIYLRPSAPVVAAAPPPAPVEPIPTPMIAVATPMAAAATPRGVEPVGIDPAGIGDALSFALEASDPYVQEGFMVREDYWGGEFLQSGNREIVHELFEGNEYWLWLGSSNPDANISVHVYDSRGKLAESDAWQKPRMAAAHVFPKKTGAFYFIVDATGKAFKPPGASAYWALAYGFRVRP